jgi:hypothetical protein
MSAGLAGERKRANREIETASSQTIRLQLSGSKRNKSIISTASATMISNRDSVKHTNIKAKLQKDKHFQIQRTKLKLEEFEKKRHKQKKDNKVQKNSGINFQPNLLGYVNINKCRNNTWIPKL